MHHRTPESHPAQSAATGATERFRGYTLEEIRYRRLVNRLKTDIVRERLALMVSPQMQRDADVIAGAMDRFQSAMKWVDMGMMAYGMFKRLCRSLRRSRPAN